MNFYLLILFLLPILLIFKIYFFFRGSSKWNYRRIINKIKESNNQYLVKIEEGNSGNTRVYYKYKGRSITLNCKYEWRYRSNLLTKKDYSQNSLGFCFKMDFQESKPLTSLKLIYTNWYNRFLTTIIKSTVQIRGNEDKAFGIIYEHSAGSNLNEIRRTVEDLITLNVLDKARKIKSLSTIQIDSNQVIVELNKWPILSLIELESIFDLMCEIDGRVFKDHTPFIEKQSNNEKVTNLELIQILLKCINNNSIDDQASSKLSPQFKTKFSKILKERETDLQKSQQKITINLSSKAKVTLEKTNRINKIIIHDSFPIVTEPYIAEYENSPNDISNWTLEIDSSTGLLIGMTEDIWGIFEVKR